MYQLAFGFVQARELTTQQSILQNQIEKLGDSIQTWCDGHIW